MILNRAHILIKDDRKDLRIKENEWVPWRIKYRQKEGLAKVRNISATGMCIETKTAFDPESECIFSFDSDLWEDSYIPQVGRLVWHKKKRFSPKRYLCGIKFLDADKKVLARMHARVQEGVLRFLKKRRMTTAAGFLVCAVSVGLIGWAVWFSHAIYRDINNANQKTLGFSGQQASLTENYARLYRVNEAKLSETADKLNIANQLIEEDKAAIALYSKELEATRALLSQTETMLAQANDHNIELNSTIRTLEVQGRQPVPVQPQASENDDGFATAGEVRTLMEEYHLKLQSLKNELKRFKHKEQAARTAALAQMDGQRMLLGNNGYLVKDGEAVWVDREQYQRLTLDGFSDAVASQTEQQVEIDITFFE
jgi:hypothetical protein